MDNAMIEEALETIAENLKVLQDEYMKQIEAEKPVKGPKLIDGIALADRLLDEAITDAQRVQAAHLKKWIEEQPEAVVRCRDCRHFVKNYVTNTRCCSMSMGVMSEDDYCSNGELNDD